MPAADEDIANDDIADCFECPLLAGLTDEEKRERLRTDPTIRSRMKGCAIVRARRTQERAGAAPAGTSIDNPQGAICAGG